MIADLATNKVYLSGLLTEYYPFNGTVSKVFFKVILFGPPDGASLC